MKLSLSFNVIIEQSKMSGYPYHQPRDVEAGTGYPSAPPAYPSNQYQPPPPQYPPMQGYAPPPPPPQQYPSNYPAPDYAAPSYNETDPLTTTYSDNNSDSYSDAGITDFSEKSVRQGFIKKVYSILFCQLLVSIGIVCLFVLHKGVNSYVRSNMAMFYTAWISTIVIIIAIACCESARRKAPLNFILLSLFTLCESYLLGVVSAHYRVNEVLMAMGIVAVLTLAITLFAFQTKIDFTMMSGCLFVALIVLICFGFLMIFFHGKAIRLVYACLGALVFGLYLVMDTQLMMGGQKKYSLSPEEYIFAALNLYIDIVTLFLYILQIIGLAND